MVTPDDAVPGRSTPVLPHPAPHAVLGTSLTGPWPDGTEVIHLAMGCFWGAEETVLAAAGDRHHQRGLHGRLHAQPDLRGGVHGPHGPHRDGHGRLRPDGDLHVRDPEGLLGEPRPDAGLPAGQRHRHAVPERRLLRDAEQRDLSTRPRPPTRASSRSAATPTSRPRSRRPTRLRTTSPRTTTSSTSTRIRTATAVTRTPAWPCPRSPDDRPARDHRAGRPVPPGRSAQPGRGRVDATPAAHREPARRARATGASAGSTGR